MGDEPIERRLITLPHARLGSLLAPISIRSCKLLEVIFRCIIFAAQEHIWLVPIEACPFVLVDGLGADVAKVTLSFDRHGLLLVVAIVRTVEVLLAVKLLL